MKELKIAPKAVFLLAAFLFVAPAWGRSHNNSLFKYVAGTEAMPKGCEGQLEVTESALVFQCGEQSLTAPYKAITEMDFMPRVSRKIRKMKLPWKIKPSSSHGKHEGFFTVLYSEKGQRRAIILKVRTDTMRPYMAEIDLKTGRPIKTRED